MILLRMWFWVEEKRVDFDCIAFCVGVLLYYSQLYLKPSEILTHGSLITM